MFVVNSLPNIVANANKLITAAETIKLNIGNQVLRVIFKYQPIAGHSKSCGKAEISQKFLTESVFEEMELVTEIEEYKEEEELSEDQLSIAAKELKYFKTRNFLRIF
jgi:hypothetical protein